MVLKEKSVTTFSFQKFLKKKENIYCSIPENCLIKILICEDSYIKSSLVILTSCLEATRGPFWNGPRHFGPWSDNEDGIYLSKLPHYQREDVSPISDLTCIRPTNMVDLRWNRVSILEPRLRSIDLIARTPRP
ncbi:hypothetical protein AVEN_246505-1 [Araneus ventricosus]|uniref:Uncharacterized protein n=1 Tax=Araneus ventricosus TaxID=182803 RepID=A0A4Y2SP75_ARAVE|nr:hypothetical protein AVEN_186961-1 [Araneus ventricosus]GBN89678.1 hypothetical protein AVEN_246505-1 [Araneus ventricosus]